jgi:hypothetical protein
LLMIRQLPSEQLFLFCNEVFGLKIYTSLALSIQSSIGVHLIWVYLQFYQTGCIYHKIIVLLSYFIGESWLSFNWLFLVWLPQQVFISPIPHMEDVSCCFRV